VDDPLVLVQEAAGAGDEFAEFGRRHGQDFADHFQFALLLVGFGGQVAQFGHVAHAQHQSGSPGPAHR
jgi:hypothetical protein